MNDTLYIRLKELSDSLAETYKCVELVIKELEKLNAGEQTQNNDKSN